MFACSSSPPPTAPPPAVGCFAHTRYYTEAEAFLLEWLNRLVKLSIHFPSLSFPLAWKSKDFYTASSQLFEFHEFSSGGRNWAEHLEILGSLWLFIRRKMLKTRSVNRLRCFRIVRDSIAMTYYLDYWGSLWSICAS